MNYLIVGSGLFGAVFAHEAKKACKKVLVIDKREHVAGNIYTKEVDGIQVHDPVWLISRDILSVSYLPDLRASIN